MVSRGFGAVVCASAIVAITACESSQPERSQPSASAGATTPSSHSPATNNSQTPRSQGRPRVVMLGDSLTAGYGLSDPAQAYPALIQQRLDAAGLNYEVVNAGVSGDTSAGGLARLDWALDGDVRVLVVALGGNDGLRGLPIEELRRNLSTIIEHAQQRGVKVVLAGMEAPPNFGASYISEFHQVYKDLANKYQVALVPFLLQGVAGIESMNQRDGIHPTREGAVHVADNVWAVLAPIVTDRPAAK